MWIMESILIFLVVSLMSSPVLGISQSMSCSTVNGQTICEKQTSTGNSAAAFGAAAVGGGQTYQDAYAGAGSSGQWDYGRQTVYGTVPGANSGAPPSGYSSGVYSSSSSSSSDFIPGQAGGFGYAGGFSVGGGGFAFGGGYPPQGAAGGFSSAGGFPVGSGGFAFGGGYPAQGAAGGFATSGVFPFGGGYPAQAPAGNPGAPQPQGFDPFTFVRPFFGGGAVAGAFAGMPFGRR